MSGSRKGPRDILDLIKENNCTWVASLKLKFLIVHKFLLRIQN
jgi:hypothetical protein